MSDDLPPPLVPTDIDLRGFPGFVLDVDRLLASELFALCTPEQGWAAFSLWCRAWKQTPPGSIPDDDKIIAKFSGAGRQWPRVKDMALRGFVKCSDGRLYHRVLCAQVMKAWESRKASAMKRERDAKRLAEWRVRNAKGNANETPDETALKRVSSPREVEVEVEVEVKRSTSKTKKVNGSAQAPFILPDWIPQDLWNAWVEARTKAKHPPTDYAKRLAVMKLDNLREQGHPPAQVLMHSAFNGWSDLYAPKENK